jgi:hypothetical protein
MCQQQRHGVKGKMDNGVPNTLSGRGGICNSIKKLGEECHRQDDRVDICRWPWLAMAAGLCALAAILAALLMIDCDPCTPWVVSVVCALLVLLVTGSSLACIRRRALSRQRLAEDLEGIAHSLELLIGQSCVAVPDSPASNSAASTSAGAASCPEITVNIRDEDELVIGVSGASPAHEPQFILTLPCV